MSLVELATEIWPQENTGALAAAHLEAWKSNGCLQELRGRLHIGPEWQKFDVQEDQEKTCHSNILSSPVGVAVRNEATGEVIGHISAPAEGRTMTIGGHRHRVVRQEADIVVAPVEPDGQDAAEDAPKYAGRRRRVSETLAAHVREGCGLRVTEAPLVKTGTGVVWFHFGGEIYEAALRDLFSGHFDAPILPGVAIRVTPNCNLAAIQGSDPVAMARRFHGQGLRLLEDEGVGKFAADLPEAGVEAMCVDLRVADRFTQWLRSREPGDISPIAAWPTLERLFQ